MGPYMGYVWISVAVILAIYEMSTVQLVAVWFVIGAVCAALSTLFVDSIVLQAVIFVAVSLLVLLATRPIVNKFRQKQIKVSTNADRLIGTIGVMTGDLSKPEDTGLAKVSGSVWSVKTDNPPLKKDDRVRVIAIEGVKLIVDKAEQ